MHRRNCVNHRNALPATNDDAWTRLLTDLRSVKFGLIRVIRLRVASAHGISAWCVLREV